jgi:hypothetical protein
MKGPTDLLYTIPKVIPEGYALRCLLSPATLAAIECELEAYDAWGCFETIQALATIIEPSELHCAP